MVLPSIVGEFDQLLAPAVVESQLESVVFCEETGLPIPPPWQCRPLVRQERNARMTARWHKLHPHLLFPNHELSLYVDGNVRLNAPVSDLIDQISAGEAISLFLPAESD